MELKEMSIKEFITEVDAYFQDSTATDLMLLEGWMREQKMTPIERFRFYIYVVQSHKYKTFPAVAFFVSYYAKFKPEKGETKHVKISEHNQLMMKEWDTYSNMKVMSILIEIHKKNILSASDMAFLNKFDAMYCEMKYMQDKGFDKQRIKQRLEKIREDINDGNRIIYSTDEEMQKEISEARMFL